jgi:hypothetical protein
LESEANPARNVKRILRQSAARFTQRDFTAKAQRFRKVR